MKGKLKRLYLIDGQGLIYRAFFALPKLTTKEGQIINAAYGFTLVLMRLLEEQKPDGIVVAFDTPKPTFRHKKYDKYKAHREKMPQELIDQLPLIKEIVRKFRIPAIEIEGFEADDIIGTIVEQTKKSKFKPIVVTGDKDLLQLIDADTETILMQKGISKVVQYQLKSAKEMLGFHPEKIPDFIGLKGDSSDNIPGIPGIGEKTAKNLIQTFGSLENILNNQEKIQKKSLKEKIKKYQKQALLSKELAVIKRDIDLDFTLDAIDYKGPDFEDIRELFHKYDFKKLLDRIPKADKKRKKSVGTNNHIFFHEVKDVQELETMVKKIESAGSFSFLLVESYSKRTKNQTGRIDSVIICQRNNLYQIRVNSINGLLDEKGIIPEKIIIDYFRTLFLNKKIEKIGYNLKEILSFLNNDDIFTDYSYFDVKIAAYLLNPSQQKYELKELMQNYLGGKRPVNLIKESKEKILSEEENDICNQAILLPQLKDLLRKQLSDYNMDSLYQDVELPLVNVIFQMEKKGVKLDTAYLKDMSQKFAKEIEKIRQDIFKMSGEEFNLNSPKQLSNILFKKLNLPVIKKIKTGYSTNAQVLHKLSEKHDIVAKILCYREMEKLKNTYIDKLPKLINYRSGRIHTSFNQTGTSTGRLSSNNPNLQNIPIRTELGRDIRNAFVAEKNHIFLSADYSQIELRILAHLSKDKYLLDAFARGEDIHSFTASQIFDVDRNIVSAEMRRIAKVINFGIIYGMSSYGLSNNLDINKEDAQTYIEAYFQRYKKVKEYIEEQIVNARKNKFVKTMLNRIRFLEGIDSPNKNIREFYERIAVNMPIQGTAADLIKVAMVRINEKMFNEGLSSGLILQIHDELIFELPKSELEERKRTIKEIMESSLELSVPLIVNFKTGRRWGNLE